MQRIGPPSISTASLSFLQRQLCRLPNACSSSSTTTLSRLPSLALALPAYPLTQQPRTMMMAGHSKWKKIKHGKGNADAKRAILFTKIAVEITEASRLAKGDTSDIRLSAAILKAKMNNCPKENIDKAIKRGVENKEATNLESVQYEGIGPASTAIIVETLTDNRKRTAPSVRHIFSKNGGALGTTGSVSWMFTRRGLVEIDMLKHRHLPTHTEEKLLEDALEAGAEDIEEEEEDDEEGHTHTQEGGEATRGEKITRVYCEPAALAEVRKGLEERGWTPSLVEFSYIPKEYVEVKMPEEEEGGKGGGGGGEKEAGLQLATLLDMMEDDPDVIQVSHNAKFV